MTNTQVLRAAASRKRRKPGLVRAVLALVPVLVLVTVAVFAPAIAPFDPERSVDAARLAPSVSHWFGTDAVGMDVFSRTVYGTRIAVRFAIVVALIATIGGILIGVFIGLSESSRGPLGLLGRLLNQISNYIIAVPDIILGIVIVGIMGASDLTLTIAITLCLIQAPIKLTRVEVLRVRGESYLEAAEMAGEPALRSALVHVVPNSLGPAMRNLPLIFGNCVIILASLGFIGVGLPMPTPEWGYMISSGVSALMLGQWWPAVFPAIFVLLSVLAVAFTARALPKTWPVLADRFSKIIPNRRNSLA